MSYDICFIQINTITLILYIINDGTQFLPTLHLHILQT